MKNYAASERTFVQLDFLYKYSKQFVKKKLYRNIWKQYRIMKDSFALVLLLLVLLLLFENSHIQITKLFSSCRLQSVSQLYDYTKADNINTMPFKWRCEWKWWSVKKILSAKKNLMFHIEITSRLHRDFLTLCLHGPKLSEYANKIDAESKVGTCSYF